MKVKYEFNPFAQTGVELPRGADREEVLESAAEYIKEQILSSVADRVSPVQGHGKFKPLSKDYLAKKREAGHPGVPNLEFSGDMLGALNTRVKGNKIVVEVLGHESEKADGHCKLSGRKNNTPMRRFIPASDEQFKNSIMQGVARIIKNGG